LILNIRALDYLPLLERWLMKDHAPEIISQPDPILERYVSCRALSRAAHQPVPA